jgi:porin
LTERVATGRARAILRMSAPESTKMMIFAGLGLVCALATGHGAAAQDAPPPPPPPPPPAMPLDIEEPQEPVTGETSDGLFQGPTGEIVDGVTIGASLIVDFSVGIKGGVDSDGTAFRNLFSFDLSLDLDTLLGVTGGTFYVLFENQDGESGSDEIAGDIQGFDEIDGDSFTQLSEVWYEQHLFKRKLRLKIGKVDANTEFSAIEYGTVFLNSSAWYSPTIFLFPSYPDPAMSVNLFLQPTDAAYLGVAVYDGALADGDSTGSRGPSSFFDDADDWFWITEAGLSWGQSEGGLPGRIAGGAWINNSDIDRFDGGEEDEAYGYYGFLEQSLWRTDPTDLDDPRGLNLFLMYGWTDEDISEIAQHVGGGLTLTGPLPGRDEDIVGLGATYAELSDDPNVGFTEDYELAIESFYRMQINPFVAVQPDFQYIFNPGGDSSIPDSFVFTLRVEVGF